MSNIAWCFGSVVLIGVAACGGGPGTGGLDPARASEQRATPAGAGPGSCKFVTEDGRLKPCLVAPDQADPDMGVDPGISRDKQWLNEHYVWLDPKREHQGKLFVLLPGQTNNNLNTPAQFTFLAREAARLGYHVIVLMYPNTVGVGGGGASVCKFTASTYDEAAQKCQENARLQVLDGIPRPPVVPSLTEPHGVYSRLMKLLEYLATQRRGEGWSRFLDRQSRDGAPAREKIAWRKIVISGFSYGGSEAALIARSNRVHRAALFGSPRDGLGNVPNAWVAPGETPSRRYYGLVHTRDPLVAVTLASWKALGMPAFGEQVSEDEATPPYGKTHMLVTNRDSPIVDPISAFHSSVASDVFTPCTADGSIVPVQCTAEGAGPPLLGNVWRYLLGAHGQGDDAEDDDPEDE